MPSLEIRRTESHYLLRLPIDAPLNASLAEFLEKTKLPGGFVHGLGALKKSELGFYHLHKKEYDRRTFNEEMELLSVQGNLSWGNGGLGGKPIVHTHVTLGGEDFRAIGGHCFEALCAVTVELLVTPVGRPGDPRIERAPDGRTGLNLLHCPN